MSVTPGMPPITEVRMDSTLSGRSTPVKDEVKWITSSVAKPESIDKKALLSAFLCFDKACTTEKATNVPSKIKANSHQGINKHLRNKNRPPIVSTVYSYVREFTDMPFITSED